MKNFKPSTFLATVFGVGLFPKAPGTVGTLFALLVYLLMPPAWFGFEALPYNVLALLLFCLISVRISALAEKSMGEDAPSIVIDEVCGFFVAVILLPHSFLMGIWGFILFRIFDIWKPYPISRSQAIPHGWGVVLDDVLAGIAAYLIIIGASKLAPQLFGI